MPDPYFSLEQFVKTLNLEPQEACVISEEVAQDITFSLKEAAELSQRELVRGAEYVRGSNQRKTIFVFFPREEA